MWCMYTQLAKTIPISNSVTLVREVNPIPPTEQNENEKIAKVINFTIRSSSVLIPRVCMYVVKKGR